MRDQRTRADLDLVRVPQGAGPTERRAVHPRAVGRARVLDEEHAAGSAGDARVAPREPPVAAEGSGLAVAAADQQLVIERDLLTLARPGCHPELGHRLRNERRHLGHGRRGTGDRHLRLGGGSRGRSHLELERALADPQDVAGHADVGRAQPLVIDPCPVRRLEVLDDRPPALIDRQSRVPAREARVTAEVAGIGFLAAEHEFGVDGDRLAETRTQRAPQRHSHYPLPPFVSTRAPSSSLLFGGGRSGGPLHHRAAGRQGRQ